MNNIQNKQGNNFFIKRNKKELIGYWGILDGKIFF